MGFLGDVGAIFSNFGVLQGLEFLPNAEPDVATMLWQIAQLFTYGGEAACCCLIVFRVFNRDLKDLRTAWRIQFLLFTIGRFFGVIVEPLFIQPHMCEEIYAFDTKDCAALGGSDVGNCTAVIDPNTVAQKMGGTRCCVGGTSFSQMGAFAPCPAEVAPGVCGPVSGITGCEVGGVSRSLSLGRVARRLPAAAAPR